MQILASALPGFRDLRAPLVAGYMWLVFVWLWAKPDPTHRPHDSIGGALFDLGHDVGHIWVGIAASVVAYLVGSLSLAVSNRIRRDMRVLFGLLSGFELGQDDRIRPIFIRGRERLLSASEDLSDEVLESLLGDLQRRAQGAVAAADRELDLPAILLVGDQPELFAEVDRLRGEADLRTAVSLPLIALAILCAMEVSWFWLALIPAAAMLFLQGVARDNDARQSMADAIRLGRAPSASSSKFEAWVDDVLPRLIAEAKDRSGPSEDHKASLRLLQRLESAELFDY